jgi:ABC-type bacteriocin/lantibiotic exporter with double-glycine peptidase domain
MSETRRDARQPALESLYRYIWRISGSRQIWLVLLSCVVFPLTMVPLELQRRIVNNAIGGLDLRRLWFFSLVYVAVVLLQGGLKYAMNVYREILSERAIRKMRREIYQGIQAGGQPSRPATGTDAPTGAHVSMVVTEVEPLGGFVGESLSVPVVQAGALLSVLGYMLWVEPRIAAASFVLYCPQLFLVPSIQAAINRRVQRRIVLVRELSEQLIQDSTESETPEARVQQYDERTHDIYRQRRRIAYLSYSITLINNLLEHSGTISVLLVGGWLAIHGRTDLGTIVAFVSGFEKIAEPWRELISFYRRASDARVKYRLLGDFLGEAQSAPPAVRPAVG